MLENIKFWRLLLLMICIPVNQIWTTEVYFRSVVSQLPPAYIASRRGGLQSGVSIERIGLRNTVQSVLTED